jgi:hypothetical protein
LPAISATHELLNANAIALFGYSLHLVALPNRHFCSRLEQIFAFARNRQGEASIDVQEFLNAIRAKKNDGNDGVSATIRRSLANCSACIQFRWRLDAVWRSGQGLFELRLYG